MYKVYGGQYRYFHFYDKKYKKDLTVPILPYPKQSDIVNDLQVKVQYGDNESAVNLEAFQELLLKPKVKVVSEQDLKIKEFFE